MKPGCGEQSSNWPGVVCHDAKIGNAHYYGERPFAVMKERSVIKLSGLEYLAVGSSWSSSLGYGIEHGHGDVFTFMHKAFWSFSSSSTRPAESHSQTASFEFYLVYSVIW